MVRAQFLNLSSILLILCLHFVFYQQSGAFNPQLSKDLLSRKLSSISAITSPKGVHPYTFPNLSVHQAVQNLNGSLGGETCFDNSTCARGDCVRRGPVACEGNRVDCICSLFQCGNDTPCLQGETCNNPNTENSTCVSQASRLIPRNGSLTGGPCRTTTDCATSRDCFSFSSQTAELCSSAQDSCICFPLDIITCTNVGSTENCPTGEVCAQIDANTTVCVDPVVVSGTTPAPQGGLTLDPCQFDSSCVAPRLCDALVNSTFVPCPLDGSSCLCIPGVPLTCTTQEECTTVGEVCTPLGNSSFCVSESAAQTLAGNSSMMTEMGNVMGGMVGSNGLTFESCVNDRSCVPPRFCNGVVNDAFVPCPVNSTSCICVADQIITCASSDDCFTNGEVCSQVGENNICISNVVAQTLMNSGNSSMMEEVSNAM